MRNSVRVFPIPVILIFIMLVSLPDITIYAQNNDFQNSTGGAYISKYRNFPYNWWEKYKDKEEGWYKSDEARQMAENICSWQTSEGGWPLMNTTKEPWTGDESAIGPWGRHGTFIYATTNEIRFLAWVYNSTGEEKYKKAALKGIGYILEAQTPTGGWPKSYPVHDEDYHSHITFNDGAMVNVMSLLRELFIEETYRFLGSELLSTVKERYELGLECIIRCQIIVNDRLTAWCQQHDEVSYEPRSGRVFEPAAISGSESVGVIRFLMSVDNPSPKIKKAVECAVQWMEVSRIEGIRVVTVPDSTFELRKIDRLVKQDSDSPPLWARYYEIGSNKPVFYGRDGIKHYNLAEIDQERRTGYAWYGTWGEGLNEEYAAWADKWGIEISDGPGRNKLRDGFFITSDSIRIHYLETGEGSPVILIHGLSATAYGNWFPNGIADSLASNHRVIAIDCRNHGLSDYPAGTLAWGSEYDVIELMDHLGIEKAHLHGYSMGGAIIAQMMAKVPERIITASMGGYGIPETDPDWIAKIPAESKGSDTDALKAYEELLHAYARSKGMTAEETEAFFNMPRNERPRILPPEVDIDLKSIDFPVMTLIGEFDRAQGKSHRMQREIKDFMHITIPGKSHNTAIMAGYMPPLYINSLVEFINQHDN